MVSDTTDLSAHWAVYGQTGFKLALFRLARALGVWRAYSWYQEKRFGWSTLPWFDPFDSMHLLFAFSDYIRKHPQDHIEITASQFASCLDPELTSLPGFDAAHCFRRLTRELESGPQRQANIMSTIARAKFLVSGVRDRLIVIDVIQRFDWPARSSDKA